MAHWSETYIGTPYSEADCAGLAVRVQAEVFKRRINLPSERAEGLRQLSCQITTLQEDFANPTYTPVEGDAVLMIGRGRINHIGIYCLIDGVPFVLHAMRNAGTTCLHRLRELKNIGLQLEGFYTWK